MKGPNRDTHHDNGSAGTGVDRRTMLRAGAAGSLVMITLPMACGGGGDAPPITNGPIIFGNVSNVPVGSLKMVDSAPAYLGRDSGGLYAMSSTCTHQGCSLPEPTPAAEAVTCACHGSKFDKNGAVLTGPATTPLQHYQVDLAADGTITIQGSQTVSSSARTPVP